MKKLSLSVDLEEKIFDLKKDGNNSLSKITTYFPLSDKEKQEILQSIEKPSKNLIEFKSIFSDKISQTEWNHSKGQIKKKFRDELIEID